MKPAITIMLLIAAISVHSGAECRPDEPAAGKKSGPIVGKEAGEVRDDNGLKLGLVWCPPGKFKMGNLESEKKQSADKGQVDVTLTRGFWLGKYEVMQEEWRQLMGTTPWKSDHVEYVNKGPKFPAMYVTWNDARAFCKKLTDQERSAGRLQAGWEFTLPTEAQWEYACRAGTTTAFSFGDDESQLGPYGWFRDVRYARQSGRPDWNPLSDEWAQAVGRKKPNPWGFYDMHGNVDEWCRDVFKYELPGGEDPEVTKNEGWGRVIRGGCWTNYARGCRSAARLWCNPQTGSNLGNRTGSNEIGFRVALVVVQ